MLSNQMTEAQFDTERAVLRERGETSVERNARWEQDLANLYYRTGWTQEHLAKKEGKSQSWINNRLLFGRFLSFITPLINSDSSLKTLTCGRFHNYWEQNDDPSETSRFRTIARLLQAQIVATGSPINHDCGAAIVKKFADGKWHKLQTIRDHIRAPDGHVEAALRVMESRGKYNCKCESKKVGASFAYRIFKQDRFVSVHELTEKLQPILEELEAEGRKHPVRIVPTLLLELAMRTRRLLKEWTEGGRSFDGTGEELPTLESPADEYNHV
jgi:hypothetical protein